MVIILTNRAMGREFSKANRRKSEPKKGWLARIINKIPPINFPKR